MSWPPRDADGGPAGLRPGARVGAYRLESRLGAGGMAVVFRARDERLGRAVALKVMSPALAAAPGFQERFARESLAAARVGHPHIIPVYEAGEADGLLFIAMRLVPGGDLRGVVRRRTLASLSEVVAVIGPMAAALDALHAAGLVHRDVKPANILVEDNGSHPGHPYLSDFGLSRAAGLPAGPGPGASLPGTLTTAGQFLGTPDYAAPEQAAGAAVGPPADQYALACVAFELLTGAPPFAGYPAMAALWAHQDEPPPLASARRPGLPPAADKVLARALAKDPQERHASCGAFAAALGAALATAPDAARRSRRPRLEPAAPEPEISRRRLRVPRPRARWVVTVAILAVAGTGIGLAAALTPPSLAPTLAAQVTVPGRAAPVALTFSGENALDGCSVGMALQWHVSAHAATPGPAVPLARGQACTAGGSLAAVDAGGSTHVWNLATGKQVATLATASPTMALSGSALLAVAQSGQVTVDQAATGRLVATLAQAQPKALALSADGATLAACAGNGTIAFWTVRSQSPESTVSVAGALASSGEPGDALTECAFSGNGKRLAVTTTSSIGGTTYVLDVPSGKLVGQANTYENGFLAISPDGSIIAVADATTADVLLENTTTIDYSTLVGPQAEGAVAAAFSPDGRELAVGDTNGQLYVWNLYG